MVSWVELVTKQFNASQAAAEWFLGHMADDTWWPMQVSAFLHINIKIIYGVDLYWSSSIISVK